MNMNGIVNVLKPPGMTSFDVVAYLRRLFGTTKIGHTGTLDPGAVGVLPVCVGKATKAIEYIVEKDKLYRAELTLGISTDTQDSSGKILSQCEVMATEKDIIEAVASFKGVYRQVPPMYSAVRVEGKKLYELARKGIVIEREPREVTIYSADILDISECTRVLFDVKCSKGTYIRTLCADIGDRLGCGGHMSFLMRLGSGLFDINSACTLEEIEAAVSAGNVAGIMQPVDVVFEHLPKVVLYKEDIGKLINGAAVRLEEGACPAGANVRAYRAEDGEFAAICTVLEDKRGIMIKSQKLFMPDDVRG